MLDQEIQCSFNLINKPEYVLILYLKNVKKWQVCVSQSFSKQNETLKILLINKFRSLNV